MTSLSQKTHAKQSKQSNLIVSADFASTEALLHCADTLGPYMAVLKTHVDLIHDLGEATVEGLKTLSKKHNLMIFKDRKLADIGNTVQKQYHGGALRISEFANVVNVSILGGEGIVEPLSQVPHLIMDFKFREANLLQSKTCCNIAISGSFSKCQVLLQSCREASNKSIASPSRINEPRGARAWGVESW